MFICPFVCLFICLFVQEICLSAICLPCNFAEGQLKRRKREKQKSKHSAASFTQQIVTVFVICSMSVYKSLGGGGGLVRDL